MYLLHAVLDLNRLADNKKGALGAFFVVPGFCLRMKSNQFFGLRHDFVACCDRADEALSLQRVRFILPRRFLPLSSGNSKASGDSNRWIRTIENLNVQQSLKQNFQFRSPFQNKYRWGVLSMMLAWFDAKEAKAFGEGLAEFYLTRAKADARGKSEKLVERKQRELLDKLTQRIVIFRKVSKLNVYKKAQLCNVFKWRLLEAGVDAAHVDELTSWVTHNL